MIYSAYKLNKQSDNIQPRGTPFPIWNQSVVSSPVVLLLTYIYHKHTNLLTNDGNIVFFSNNNFLLLYTIQTIKFTLIGKSGCF